MTSKTEAPEKIKLDADEEKDAQELTGLRAPVIFEIIRREGEEELDRPAFSLATSGFTAGLAIGFSVIGQAILRANLPDAPWTHLVESLGYTAGFLIIIMARLQLFTENTITPVLPLLLNPSINSLTRTLRLWAIVLFANLAGCFAFASIIMVDGAIPGEVFTAVLSISHHMMENSVTQMFMKGIFSGFLIAALVWMLPTAETAKFSSIVLITYIIAAGGFTHIVAGSVEAFALLIVGDISFIKMVTEFFLPVLFGNIFGGTILFALLSYGQVSQEIKPS